MEKAIAAAQEALTGLKKEINNPKKGIPYELAQEIYFDILHLATKLSRLQTENEKRKG